MVTKYHANWITSWPLGGRIVHDVLFLIPAHEDVLVEAPSSRGAHCKIKPAAVLNYKYKQVWRDQTSCCPIIHLHETQ
jgi:hypothetical protein